MTDTSRMHLILPHEMHQRAAWCPEPHGALRKTPHLRLKERLAAAPSTLVPLSAPCERVAVLRSWDSMSAFSVSAARRFAMECVPAPYGA